MRALIIIILTLPLLAYSQDQINWMTWDQMIAKRQSDSIPKKVFIDLYTGWCGWCKRMDATTFKQKAIVDYMNQKYYAVKFDAETRDTINFNGVQFVNSDPLFEKRAINSRGKPHWFAHSILDGKLSYPSYALLDENLIRLAIYNGFKQQEELIGILFFFGADQHKYYHNLLYKQWNESNQKINNNMIKKLSVLILLFFIHSFGGSRK